MKPRSGPKAHIRIVEVRPRTSFTVESRLPLCRLMFGHELKADGGETQATHWVRFVGPLGFLFRRLVGRQIAAALPDTMRGLKIACEDQRTNA